MVAWFRGRILNKALDDHWYPCVPYPCPNNPPTFGEVVRLLLVSTSLSVQAVTANEQHGKTKSHTAQYILDHIDPCGVHPALPAPRIPSGMCSDVFGLGGVLRP